MVHGRLQGSSGCVFRFLAVYIWQIKWVKGRKKQKGESQKDEVRRKKKTGLAEKSYIL